MCRGQPRSGEGKGRAFSHHEALLQRPWGFCPGGSLLPLEEGFGVRQSL